MITTNSVTAPNSLVFLISAADPQISTDMVGAIAATSTCVSIGTLSEMDGPTEITLADEDVELTGLAELYRGTMDTSLRRVETSIAVWGSDADEPDRVVVRMG